MALALLVLLSLIVVLSAYFFSQSWGTSFASIYAASVDRRLSVNLWILGAVFIVTQIVLGWFLWRYRKQTVTANSTHSKLVRSSVALEALWFTLAALLFLGMNLFAARTWAAHGFIGASAKADPVRIEVTGEQFRWYFRYPGKDEKFGGTKPELQDASIGNPLGIDPNDKSGEDDRISSVLILPQGKDVEITLRAHDVIHGFFIPALRLKQDAVPGMSTVIHFAADNPGDYELVCAELCGLGHHQMNAKVKVLPQEAFARWLTTQDASK
ncbi:MAG TPA: cytochrome c oxidase subunit II [Terriglobales bacterium]|nr:cytochrome c oxidase subunit II [Terriglobales bacterium]